MNNDHTLFKKYISERFKGIRCKGYLSRYNPEGDYNTAKHAIDAGFTEEGFRGLTFEEAAGWAEKGGWVGWLIPEGYVAIDVEGNYKIQLVELIDKTLGLRPLIHVSDKGKHYIFKLCENLPGSSKAFTKCGIEVTLRVGKKKLLNLIPSQQETVGGVLSLK